MSISTKNTDPADREFADVVFAPNPEKVEKPAEKAEVTPAKEEKPTTPPAKEEKPATDTPAPEKKKEKEEKPDSKAEEKAEETPKKEEEEKKESSEKSKSDKKEEKPSKESAPKEEAPAAKAETSTPSKKENSTLMDAILLGVLALLIAGGGFFIYNQMEMYNVPSPYEQAKAEYDRLKAELETLRGGNDKGNTRVTKSVGLINELKNTENAIISFMLTMYLVAISSTDNTMNYPLLTGVLAMLMMGNSFEERARETERSLFGCVNRNEKRDTLL